MPDPAPETQPQDSATPPVAPAGFVAQDQVNAIATREAERAARAERQRIEAYLAEQAAEAERQNMAEVDRLRSERDAARAQAEQAQAQAQAERLAANVERRLLAAGVPDTALTRAVRMVNLDPGADDDAITAEIDALRTEVPALFTPTTDGTTPVAPPAPGVPPVKPPPARGGGQTPAEKARERHERNQAARPGLRPTAA